MSTPALHPRTTAAPATRVTASRVVHAEWLKFRTLRSSWLTLLAAVLAMVAFGGILGYATSIEEWATLEAENRAASAPLDGYNLAQLLVGVLGVLFVTGEYGTGMIRSTFAAEPRRLSVVGAKSAVFGTVALVAMSLASVAAFLAAQPFLSGAGHGSSLADPGVLRAVAGVGIYLTLVGLLGGALGWIVRSTAGGISALVGVLLIVPLLVGLLPGSAGETIATYLPSNAGAAITRTYAVPDALGPWTGIGVFAVWVVGALVAAALVVRRRDA